MSMATAPTGCYKILWNKIGQQSGHGTFEILSLTPKLFKNASFQQILEFLTSMPAYHPPFMG